MNSIILSEDDISPKHRIKSQGNESTIYSIDGLLYKFLFPEKVYKKEIIIEALHDNPIVNTPTPIDKIVGPLNNQFSRYTMPKYNGFITLEDFFNTGKNKKDYSFEKRQSASLDILASINMIVEQGYYFWDMNLGNIMYKDGKCRLIDVDAMINPSLGVNIKDSVLNGLDTSRKDLKQKMIHNSIDIIMSLLLNHDVIYRSYLMEPIDDELINAFISGNLEEFVIDNNVSIEDVLNYLNKERTLSFMEEIEDGERLFKRRK